MPPKFIHKTEYVGKAGVKYLFEYYDSDTFEHLPADRIKQAYAVAFHGDKFLVVNNAQRNHYGLIGGSVEPGENPNDTLVREIKEESNMEVLDYKMIGYQKVTNMDEQEEPYYQLRYFAIVRPYGPFVSDPAGSVTEIVECDHTDYKKYFDWKEIGDHIIQTALQMKNSYKK